MTRRMLLVLSLLLGALAALWGAARWPTDRSLGWWQHSLCARPAWS